jgi:small subunit ribosomal protein S17
MEVNKKRIITGRVVSKKMEKTVTVKVERTYRHPLVGKVVFSYKKFHIHDPLEQAQVGDVVEFYEGKPVSKTKYMYLHRIVTSAQK